MSSIKVVLPFASGDKYHCFFFVTSCLYWYGNHDIFVFFSIEIASCCLPRESYPVPEWFIPTNILNKFVSDKCEVF